MKEFYSTIIVGAGPAGSNLARCMDSQKQDVLLINGAEIRGAKPCGGLLSPDAQDLLAAYDISLSTEVMASPQLFSVKTLDLESEYVQYYRRSYMNVDREKFDRFLVDMVPDTVDMVSASCCKVERQGKGFSLTLRTETGEKQVQCDYLVGADGANSIVRRSLFPNRKIQRYTAIQQWFDAQEEVPFYSCIFDNSTSPSCSWIFFKDGAMIFGGAFAPKHSREAFEKQKEKLVERGIVPKHIFAAPRKTEACMVARPHFFGGIYQGNQNAFLIGEAAGFISPSSLEGISFALESSDALANAFSQGMYGDKILHYYRRKTEKLRWKVRCKCMKRPFMYHKILRTWILKSGISAIKLRWKEKEV